MFSEILSSINEMIEIALYICIERTIIPKANTFTATKENNVSREKKTMPTNMSP